MLVKFFLSSGPGAETQHHPADVRRESRRGRGASARPGGRQEHVQDPNRRAAQEPEIASLAFFGRQLAAMPTGIEVHLL